VGGVLARSTNACFLLDTVLYVVFCLQYRSINQIDRLEPYFLKIPIARKTCSNGRINCDTRMAVIICKKEVGMAVMAVMVRG